MNLKDVLDKLKKHSNLVGRKVGKNQISALVIIPMDGANQGKIISRVNMGEGYHDLLTGSTDFFILALYDLEEYRMSGFLITDPLDRVFDRLQMPKDQR